MPAPDRSLLTTAALAALADSHGLAACPTVLVGDGSGAGWDGPCGWACAELDRDTGRVSVTAGGLAKGTVNVAEAMAYLGPLTALAGRHGRGVRPVGVITDSTVTLALMTAEKPPEANRGLWAFYREQARMGLALTVVHVPRNESPWFTEIDRLSKLARARFLPPRRPAAPGLPAGRR